MSCQEIWILIISFFVILICFPIAIEIRISLNPLHNRCVFAVFVFGKKVFYYVVSFHGTYIKLENESETKSQKIEFESEKFEFVDNFAKNVFDRIGVKKVGVFYNIGVDDAMSGAIVCGVINQILSQVFLKVKSKKPTAYVSVFNNVSYNQTVCEFAVTAKMAISLFDVFYSFVLSFVKTKLAHNRSGDM